MAIAALRRFDNVTAAGILARAAFAVDDRFNPAAAIELPDEAAIRSALLSEIRRNVGIGENDQSAQALERLSNALDAEREGLSPTVDSDAILKELAVKGQLPSDMYRIDIVQPIQEFHGSKFDRERKLIEQTVRAPGREQNYGAPESPNEPFLISLYARYFPDVFPNRSFTMLVAGQRNDLTLFVHQAWRIYADTVNLAGAETLLDMLERFANSFGIEIKIGNEKGHFIRTVTIPQNEDVNTILDFPADRRMAAGRKKKRRVTVTSFTQRHPIGEYQAALGVGIDLDRYKHMLISHGY